MSKLPSHLRPTDTHQKYRQLLDQDIAALFKPAADWPERACPLCGATASEVWVSKTFYAYHQCSQCSLIAIKPCPTQQALQDYYENSASAAYFQSTLLKEVYGSRQQGLFRPRMQMIMDRAGKGSQKLLDLGASIGSFVEVANQAGWQACGVEWNEAALADAKKRGLHLTSHLDDLPDHDFDVLTAWEVVAHLIDPIAFLQKALTKLKPGGLVFLSTPNANAYEYQLLGEHHPNAEFSFLQFFSTTTILLYLKKAGLELLDLTTPGQTDLQTLASHAAACDTSAWPSDMRDFVLSESQNSSIAQKIQQRIMAEKKSGHMILVARQL